MKKDAVLVTGGNGFVGRAVVESLLATGVPVTAAVRRAEAQVSPQARKVIVGGLGASTLWSAALESVDAVIHTAARVHVMDEQSIDPLTLYRQVNVDGTLALARQAAHSGVRRFVFVSSIKVNGEQTLPGRPFQAEDVPMPCDPYGRSKYEAEQGLQQLSKETGLEVVIVRPVLVYGAGVGANVASLMRWLRRGVPLPLGAIDNRRSLVNLANLVDFLQICVQHPQAAGQTFLVSDDHDLSTTELLRRMGQALGCRPLLLPVPPVLLKWVGRMTGKNAISQRLLGSLQVDISKNQRLLGWRPSTSVDQGLQVTAAHFLESLR